MPVAVGEMWVVLWNANINKPTAGEENDEGRERQNIHFMVGIEKK